MEYVFWFALLATLIAFLVTRRSGRAGETASVAPELDLAAVAEYVERVPFVEHHPQRMAENPAFGEAVDVLRRSGEPNAGLAAWAHPSGDNPVAACVALEALARRGPDREVGETLLRTVGMVRVELMYFHLRALPALLPERSLVSDVLLAVARNWDSGAIRGFVPLHGVLREFCAARVEAGEQPELEHPDDTLNDAVVSDFRALLDSLALPALGRLAEDLERWSATRIDVATLNTLGRVWTEEAGRTAVEHVVPRPEMDRAVDELVATLDGRPPRSVVLLGEAGVGKTVLARLALRRMQERGWTVFEAGSTELQAGTSLIGEFEARIKTLVHAIDARRRVVWFAPDFGNVGWVGRHRYSPVGALDRLLPDIELGRIVVLGECEPASFEELTRQTPGCASALRCVRVEPVDETATLDLARRWIAAEAAALGHPGEHLVPEPVLREAWQLADQYLRERAAPGNVLHLLATAVQQLTGPPSTAQRPDRPLAVDDLIATLGEVTGLPSSILDERENVDLAALRRFFERRVMGQPEAVDCLVERVAMLKAGVTDPTRPAGVFLFAGPTGTGKTEIAKALAEFLFGSEQRLVRLDMSEMGSSESLSRILGLPGESAGDPRAGQDRSLVEAVRKQPFSVILLDEFEKAHPAVWDLFLQVFDDGRLTDRRGVVADFRHAIVILTSNLGVSLPFGASLGFTGANGEFRPESVMREIDRSFRREFVNRLDRIVVFRPLGRETMRAILRREIELALQRRGLRNRRWAVEWEQPALEFLLEQGFTPDLGARPLKRAIEQYFLAPLATTIVEHAYPRGDQFLFVRAAGKRLEVVFVDPDAPEPPAEPSGVTETPPAHAELGAIVLSPRGTPAELDAIAARLREVAERVEHESWQERKLDLLARLGIPGFWDAPGRFAVLGEIEYLDRIEAALNGSRSLLARLTDPKRGTRASVPKDPVGRLGQQVYLLDAATMDVLERRPRDAFVEVDAGLGSGGSAAQRNAFARRIGEMYAAWAVKRGMQLEVLEDRPGDDHRAYRLCLAVSGFAAHAILAPEEGVHVHETPEDEGGHSFRKCAIHVRVAPQPEQPPTTSADRDRSSALRAQAYEALAARGADNLRIVRRYRELPSPLVRDEIRGWRTGLLAVVLGGGFDVLS